MGRGVLTAGPNQFTAYMLVNSTNDLAADQAAITAAATSITRIATTTQFNGKALLDGTFTLAVG